MPSSARIQASRTYDGKYLVYTWAESDTNFTNPVGYKWNSVPDIKARAFNVTSGQFSSNKINITKPSSGSNPLVASHAQMHFSSPVCPKADVCANTPTAYTITLPITVSNNQNIPLAQLQSNTHWYSAAKLAFGQPCIIDGVGENPLNKISGFNLFPNPASGIVGLNMDLRDNAKVKVSVFNAVGQLVKTINVDGQAGENAVTLNIAGMPSGIYIVKAEANGNSGITKKLIIE
jgi:hypothetical protein